MFIIVFLTQNLQAQPPSDAVLSETDGPVSEEASCRPPSESQFMSIAKTVGICSPMAMAAGAAAFPATSAALSTLLGRLGGQLALRANQAGIILTVAQAAGLFAKGLASIEQCRVEEIEYKRSIIREVIERGRQYERALDAAADRIGPMTERQRNRLRFPANRMTEERIKNWYCGELVLYAEYIKGLQVRVYSEMTEGKMVVVPLPEEETERVVSENDRQLVTMVLESLQCLSPRDYVEGVCMVGNFILFGTPLHDKIIKRMHRQRGLKDSEEPPSQNSRDDVVDSDDSADLPVAGSPADDFETSTDIATRQAFDDLREQKRNIVDLDAHRFPHNIGARVNVGGRQVTIKERLGDGGEGFVYRVEDQNGRALTLKVFGSERQANLNQRGLDRMRTALGDDAVVSVVQPNQDPTSILFEYIHGTDFNLIRTHPGFPPQTKMLLEIKYEEMVRKAKAAGLKLADFNIVVRESDLSLIVIDPF